MNDSRRWAIHAVLHPQFFTVTSISCQINQKYSCIPKAGFYLVLSEFNKKDHLNYLLFANNWGNYQK